MSDTEKSDQTVTISKDAYDKHLRNAFIVGRLSTIFDTSVDKLIPVITQQCNQARAEKDKAVEDAERQLAALFINAAGGRVVLSMEVMMKTSLNPKIHREILPDNSVEYWLDEEA